MGPSRIQRFSCPDSMHDRQRGGQVPQAVHFINWPIAPADKAVKSREILNFSIGKAGILREWRDSIRKLIKLYAS
jgi:hypothetical protein